MRNSKNLIYHELIGLDVIIADHVDRSLVGRRGKVVDEYMNVLIVDDGIKKIKVPKLGGRFIFKLPKEDVVVRGELIIGRPEDRIKRYRGGI